MAGLEDMIRSSAPGGNIGKPLMLALLALFASGALFRSGGGDRPADTPSQPTSDEGAGGLLGGLGGCSTSCRRVGSVTLPIRGSVLAKINPHPLGNLARPLARTSSRCLLNALASPKKKSPSSCRRCCRA